MSEHHSTSDATTTIAKAYVREMLELNPMWQSSLILRRRRELWTGGEATSAVQPVRALPDSQRANQQLEERARRCLERVQTEFYRLPAEKLKQYLDFLNNRKLPEYAVRAKRLLAVAEHRDTLLRMESETRDAKFAYSLMFALIGSPANAGALKEMYIESIIAERRVKPAGMMVKSFVDRYPQIYELERDWFNLLLSAKNQKQWASHSSINSTLFPSKFRVVIFLMFASFLFVAFATVIGVASLIGIARSKANSRTLLVPSPDILTKTVKPVIVPRPAQPPLPRPPQVHAQGFAQDFGVPPPVTPQSIDSTNHFPHTPVSPTLPPTYSLPPREPSPKTRSPDELMQRIEQNRIEVKERLAAQEKEFQERMKQVRERTLRPGSMPQIPHPGSFRQIPGPGGL